MSSHVEHRDLRSFVEEKFKVKEDARHPSQRENIYRFAALGKEALRDGEKARFLPMVGLFAQGDVVKGERDMGRSYAAGLYLKWSLFDAMNFGAVKQAQASADALWSTMYAEKERVEGERHSDHELDVATNKALVSLEESQVFLEEQAGIARQLFQSGSINALQLAEVFARRADLIENMTKLQRQWLEVRGRRVLNHSEN